MKKKKEKKRTNEKIKEQRLPRNWKRSQDEAFWLEGDLL